MKTRFHIPATFLLLILQVHCAGQPQRLPAEKNPDPPQPPVLERVPRKVYPLSFASAWEGALRSLRETNIPLAAWDREKGIIRTDYLRAAEFRRDEKTFSARYKYDISLFPEGGIKTGLEVRCLYEIREKGEPSFKNANDRFPDEVIALEDELYQIIESALRRAETSGTARPRRELKERASPPPKDSASPPSPSPQIFLLTKKNAHLREGPSAESRIILTFRPGRKVEKIEEVGNWVRVRIWGTTLGWVQKDFLEEVPP